MPDQTSRLAAQAAAVRAHKNRVIVSSRRFSAGQMRARILVGGEYYDVGERELAALKAGATPDDLWLEPAQDE